MKFLQELVKFTRIDDEGVDEDQPMDELGADEDLPTDDELGDDLPAEDGFDEDPAPEDEFAVDEEPVEGDLVGDEETMGEEPAMEEPSEPEDPNRQGMIRTVKGAHLVYKREVEDGTYEELWQYNTSTLRDEITVRKAILAGTDIPVNKAQSPDGSQSFETWAAGNAELMLIRGLQQ